MDDTPDAMDHWCRFQSLTHGRGNGLPTTAEACTSTPPWFTQRRGSLGRMISLHSRSAPFCMRRSRWKHNYELMSFLLMTLSPIGMYSGFRARHRPLVSAWCPSFWSPRRSPFLASILSPWYDLLILPIVLSRHHLRHQPLCQNFNEPRRLSKNPLAR